MIYEVIATIRVARDEYGIYLGTIDHMDGSAPEVLEGYNTLDALTTSCSRSIAERRREEGGEDAS